MPPNAPYGQQNGGGQLGYTGQPYPQQPQVAQAPYGPPQAAVTPYYGGAAPTGPTPALQPMQPMAGPQPAMRDPYAWQRQAKAAVDRSAQQFGAPAVAAYNQYATVAQPQQQAPYGPPAYQQAQPQQPPAYGYGAASPASQPTYPQPQAVTAQQPATQYQTQQLAFNNPLQQMSQQQSMAGPGPYSQQALPQPQYTYGQRSGKRWPFSMFGNRKAMTASFVVVGVIGTMGGLTLLANLGNSANNSASIVSGDGEKVTPEQLFQNSLVNSLQTKSYTQKVTADGLQVERKVDVSAVTATRLSGSATLSDRNTVVEAYATVNDTYAKLIKTDLLTAKPTLQGTWLQARKAGKVLETPAASPSLFELLFTPPTALYDPFVVGNYSTADRQSLQKIIDEQLVYRFDPSSVIQSTIDGQEASEFAITVSASGRQALAAKAAELAGVSQERITEAKVLAQLAGNANIRLTVAVSNKEQRIIQVKEEGDKPRTTAYTAYNNTVPTAAPPAAAAWDAAFR